MKIQRADWIIFILAVAIFGGWLLINSSRHNDGALVEIQVDGEVLGTYSLDTEQIIPIAGDNDAENTVWIHDGCVEMKEASCPDLLCCKQHAIRYDKETIVCLPNRVVITVHAPSEGTVDAVAR